MHGWFAGEPCKPAWVFARTTRLKRRTKGCNALIILFLRADCCAQSGDITYRSTNHKIPGEANAIVRIGSAFGYPAGTLPRRALKHGFR